MRRDEDQPKHPAAFLLEFAQWVVVEDRVVDGHRDELLGLESERGTKFLLREPGESDLPNDDALVADAEVDLPALESTATPELADGFADDLRLPDLARLNGPFGQRHLGGADDDRSIAALELGGATAVAPISKPTRTFAIYGPSVRTERSSRKRSRSVSRSR